MAANVTATSVHARRFGLVYLALAAVVGAAVGVSIVLGERGGHRTESWSAWRPTARPEVRTKEIAAHIADAYQTSPGQRVVDVVVGPPPNAPVLAQIATPPAGAGLGDRTKIYDASHARLYILCGTGKNCSTTTSVPTTLLLRREGLELALYTFKYVGDAGSVVTFLPGATKQQPRNLLFFTRKDLEPQLSHPLATTLDESPVPDSAARSAEEARRVVRLTAPHLFQFQIVPVSSSSDLLKLDPIWP